MHIILYTMPTLLIKNLPDDLKKYIVKVQGETKNKKGISQYSMEAALLQIIKEHKENSEKK